MESTSTSSPILRARISTPLAQELNGHSGLTFSPPTSPASNVIPGAEHSVVSPVKSAPEIIELLDSDEENEGGDQDARDVDHNVEEVEELPSDAEDPVDESSTTGDLIMGGEPYADRDDISAHETPEGVVGQNDVAVAELSAIEPYYVDDSSDEAASVTSKGHAEISTDLISADGFDSANEEVHEGKLTELWFQSMIGRILNDNIWRGLVPADVRYKASLLESFLANADILTEPLWNARTHNELMYSEHRPASPVANATTLEDKSRGSPMSASPVNTWPEERMETEDTETHVQNLSGTGDMYIASTQSSTEDPDDMRESREAPQTLSTETPKQAAVHYTVSEVMTDDGQRSTSPDDLETDVVSITGNQAEELAPYVVEEPVSEDRLAEVRRQV